MSTFETTLRYKNLNDRNIVETHPEYYDSVLFQGHLVAHSNKAVPQLIRDMANERSFNYYIDPMLTDFRAGTNFRDVDDEIRGWHHDYVNQLDGPLKSVLKNKPNLRPDQLSEDVTRRIAESVVRFQEDIIYERLKEQVGKYEDPNIDKQDVQPHAVIPWTHRIESVEDIDVYRDILTYSDKEATVELKPSVYTTIDFIADATNRSLLTDLLNEFDVKETFVQLDNLDKYDIDEPQYLDVIDYVYDLSQSGVQPHFYYGDFFSNLLAYFGLGGTAFATLYDEEYTETVERQGEGGPPARYYLDKVKAFLKVEAAVDVMQKIDGDLCDCEFCSSRFDSWQDIVDRDQSDDPLKPILKKHRVAVRWKHARLVEENSLDEVLEELKEEYDEVSSTYGRSPQVSPKKDLQYIPRWLHAVEDRKELAEERIGDIQFEANL